MRAFVAYTTALVTFFAATGIVNARFVAGMEWDEVALARAIGAPLMVLTARPYGLWRNAMLARFASGASASPALWDTIALLLFQVAIYVAIITVGGRPEASFCAARWARPRSCSCSVAPTARGSIWCGRGSACRRAA